MPKEALGANRSDLECNTCGDKVQDILNVTADCSQAKIVQTAFPYMISYFA